jgi:hypothetical protein
MRLRERVRSLIKLGQEEELDALVTREPRALRFLLGLSYSSDAPFRHRANAALARSGNSHPDLLQSITRRLIWAMNDESGTNALTAPEVIAAIAKEAPDLLLPMVPDLIRLCGDDSLRPNLAIALALISKGCPGRVGQALQGALNKQLAQGCQHES